MVANAGGTATTTITTPVGMTGLESLDRWMSGDYGEGYGKGATVTIEPKTLTTKTAEELWDFVVDCANSTEDGVREIQRSIEAARNEALAEAANLVEDECVVLFAPYEFREVVVAKIRKLIEWKKQ